jgi:hypothetical protein
MSATKAEIVSDVILRISKGAPSDDLELEPAQVAYWFDIVADKLVADYLNKQIASGYLIDPPMIVIEDDKTAVSENVAMLEDCKDRVYITTSKKVMDLNGDRGVLRVITEEGVVVNKVSLEGLDTLNAMTFSRPNKNNLLYTRVGDNKIYIHGITGKSIDIVQFSVSYIPEINISSLAPTDRINIPDKLVGMIADMVGEMARAQMSGVADIESEGEDDNQPPR